MSPRDPDFNWVQAFLKCSVENEFERLERSVKASVEERQKSLPSNETGRGFSFHRPSRVQFEVSRHPVGDAVGLKLEVIFELRNDHILVTDNFRKETFTLTLTLGDDGECRFKIEGEKGKYLHWQVVRRALEPLFFQLKPKS